MNLTTEQLAAFAKGVQYSASWREKLEEFALEMLPLIGKVEQGEVLRTEQAAALAAATATNVDLAAALAAATATNVDLAAALAAATPPAP